MAQHIQYENVRIEGLEPIDYPMAFDWFRKRMQSGWELEEILVDKTMNQLIYSFKREVHDDD